MNNGTHYRAIAAALALAWLPALAQVPVDDDGQPIGDYEPADADYRSYQSDAAKGNEGIPLLSAAELQELVGPIALYPDDLLAIVLPASTYPLQVVQAARFLEALEDDPGLEPDPDWDDSIVALINYPEVVELLNEDLDWTWRLGEAVVAQQADVVNAVEDFRHQAYAAGNLKSDEHQNVSHDDGIIEITPVRDDIIYVPYYEPERVIVYQRRPVYFYYPRPCPVYYYPYPSYHTFHRNYFWGVTTAFRIGWTSRHLRVFHHSYHGHPFYGYSYFDRWWYRRPTIHVHNNVYIDNSVNVSVNRYTSGDHWRPSRHTRLRVSDQRVTRSRFYPSSGTTRQVVNQTTNSTRNVTSRSRQSAAERRASSTEDMRRTITQVQRDRQVQNRPTVPRQTVERQAAQRDLAQRQPTRRRDSAGNNRQREQRQPVQRQPVQRQSNERRDAAIRPDTQRQATPRQSVPPQTTRRETVERRSTVRQPVQRPATPRRSEPQRQTVDRRPVQRQTTQRQTTQRQTTQRQTTQRQTTERRTTQRSAQPSRSERSNGDTGRRESTRSNTRRR